MAAIPSPQKTGFSVFTKSSCKYCDKVKDLFCASPHMDPEPMFVLCDDFLKGDETKRIFLMEMKKHIGKEYRTFPMVFKNGIFIGGSEEAEVFFTRSQYFGGVNGGANEDF
jgi:glutaredoxin